jgi:hypothetical protein
LDHHDTVGRPRRLTSEQGMWSVARRLVSQSAILNTSMILKDDRRP